MFYYGPHIRDYEPDFMHPKTDLYFKVQVFNYVIRINGLRLSRL